jgi:Acyl-CoA thioesterase C-terminal domain/Acyl-CoA thioesterase N-terminal domain
VTGSFYIPLGGDRWRATAHTTGPWDVRAQHGGPPSALMARAIQGCAPRDDMIFARFTCEILRVIPVGELQVQAELTRAGRSVELFEAVARAGGRDVARARAWRVLRTDSEPVAARSVPAPELPDEGGAAPPPPGWVDGYVSAVEWRMVRGDFASPGPATVWARLRYPLVPDEETSPLQRVLAVADSGNGASAALDVARWQFINPELTVHLHREPAGDWICLDASTTISTGGAGLATSVLYDLGGPVGVGAQSLLVAPRRSG